MAMAMVKTKFGSGQNSKAYWKSTYVTGQSSETDASQNPVSLTSQSVLSRTDIPSTTEDQTQKGRSHDPRISFECASDPAPP